MTVDLSPALLGRPAAVALSVAIAVGAMLPAATTRAAEPNEAAGARHLADTLGGSPNDYTLLHERELVPDHGGAPMWSAKYLDLRTGEVHAVYRDPLDGTLAGEELAVASVDEAAAGLTPLELKADDELLAAVAAATAGGAIRLAVDGGAEPAETTVPVGVWLAVDVTAAELAVAAGHPELTWDGGRPLVDDIETARAIRAELAAATASARASALDALRLDVEPLGGTLAYASSMAPLAYVDMPASAVGALAALPSVDSIGLERTWAPAMTAAGPATEADWTVGGEDQGAGIRVAVVEYHNVRDSGDLAGRVVSSYSTSGSLAYTSGGEFDHPTWVAGAIAGGSGTYPGGAPGAVIVSASTGGGGVSLARDRDIINAAAWAASPAGGDADIINASIGQDTATGSEEARRYFDTLVYEQGRLAVASAGNYSTFGHWQIVSPGTAYNVLTVGGLDDRGTAGRGDDLLWYYPGSNGSNYQDATGAAWNSHGDYNKPNVSAPAPSVRTANGLAASGTSISSPIVAGIAAQLLSRAPLLLLRPEGTRAIIMAGAVSHTPMPDGSLNADHEGTGSASALWANRLLATGDSTWGGNRLGTMTGGNTVVQQISVVAGQTVKVVVSWNSHTSGGDLSTRSDALATDMDLRVLQPDGSAVGSFSFDNNYEWVEFVASRTGTARIEVSATRFAAGSERYGLAWSKTSPFWDVEGSPFYPDILWIAQQQITLGCGDGQYCPAAPVTREQMASFLARALRLPASGADYFDDDAGSPHEGNINALAASGITLGCASRQFCPGAGVSREEMASFLVRALGLPASGGDFFEDDSGSIHEGNINALAASGTTNGCGGSSFCPWATVTRDQMAAFLHRGLAP
ncbi:MAG: S8 family serine peptidase [Candidatus Limnocylindria bacterium]